MGSLAVLVGFGFDFFNLACFFPLLGGSMLNCTNVGLRGRLEGYGSRTKTIWL